jgi:hypothetical protein
VAYLQGFPGIDHDQMVIMVKLVDGQLAHLDSVRCQCQALFLVCIADGGQVSSYDSVLSVQSRPVACHLKHP